jgi:predicted nuclease of restriction endonuclease-like (RecB) superfamily
VAKANRALISKCDYDASLSSIVKRVEESKRKAITSVNRLLIDLYWFIGETVVNLQEKGKWGDGVVEKLSQDLRMKYPEQSGFSMQNLWRMKEFYGMYRNDRKLSPLARELSWTHNVLILHGTRTIQEKEFYIKMCIKEHWSKRELQRQIDSSYFERFVLSSKPNELAKSKRQSVSVPLEDINRHLKDEYVLEFLGLSETFLEKELRKAILANMRDFFLEFGKNLCFVGEEHPIVVDGEEFRIDLLFFHRELKCLFAVELKIGDFRPEYVGKMQFYLAALDEAIRMPHENPSIGMILCRSKKDGIVRLTMAKAEMPIKISIYETKLPDRNLIKERLESIRIPDKAGNVQQHL